MKQSKNNIDCTPSTDEEGVAKCLIQMCKDSNAGITSFSMSCEDGYEVTISARKKGKRIYNEFSLEEFEAIKACKFSTPPAPLSRPSQQLNEV